MQTREPPPHIPVLLEEILEHLGCLENKLVVDGTFGAGGYTSAFLKRGARVVACDRDPNAIKAGQSLQQVYAPALQLVEAKFSELEAFCPKDVDVIVLDIGVSSMQLDEAQRGFSFQKEGPLDMRMAQRGTSAADVLNHLSAQDLAHIFRYFGEERYALPIARRIVKRRVLKPFLTTRDLAQLIEAMVPAHVNLGVHPATRVFQALRIFVNQELQELVLALEAAERLLKPGGYLAVVSFHSLEDRIVKKFLRGRSTKAVSRYVPDCETFLPSFVLPFKGAISPSLEEISANPRARSAKLRMAQRTPAPAHKSDRAIFGLPRLPDIESFKHAYF